jgi:hypothetical protein
MVYTMVFTMIQKKVYIIVYTETKGGINQYIFHDSKQGIYHQMPVYHGIYSSMYHGIYHGMKDGIYHHCNGIHRR